MSTWRRHDPPLHPEVVTFLNDLDASGVRPFHEVGLEAARERINENALKNSLDFDFIGEILDMDIGEENEGNDDDDDDDG